MAKLYATLENSKGKTVSLSDNDTITALDLIYKDIQANKY